MGREMETTRAPPSLACSLPLTTVYLVKPVGVRGAYPLEAETSATAAAPGADATVTRAICAESMDSPKPKPTQPPAPATDAATVKVRVRLVDEASGCVQATLTAEESSADGAPASADDEDSEAAQPDAETAKAAGEPTRMTEAPLRATSNWKRGGVGWWSRVKQEQQSPQPQHLRRAREDVAEVRAAQGRALLGREAGGARRVDEGGRVEVEPVAVAAALQLVADDGCEGRPQDAPRAAVAAAAAAPCCQSRALGHAAHEEVDVCGRRIDGGEARLQPRIGCDRREGRDGRGAGAECCDGLRVGGEAPVAPPHDVECHKVDVRVEQEALRARRTAAGLGPLRSNHTSEPTHLHVGDELEVDARLRLREHAADEAVDGAVAEQVRGRVEVGVAEQRGALRKSAWSVGRT